MVDPIVLSTITSAIAVLGNEYLKGMASEAAKKTWGAIKDVLDWTSDPQLPEIPQKAAEAISASPDIAEKLLELLQHGQTGSASALVGKLHVAEGGKVVIAQNIEHLHM